MKVAIRYFHTLPVDGTFTGATSYVGKFLLSLRFHFPQRAKIALKEAVHLRKTCIFLIIFNWNFGLN